MIVFKKHEKEILKAYRQLVDLCGGKTDGWIISNQDYMFSTDWISKEKIKKMQKRYKLCEQFEKAEALKELLEENESIYKSFIKMNNLVG